LRGHLRLLTGESPGDISSQVFRLGKENGRRYAGRLCYLDVTCPRLEQNDVGRLRALGTLLDGEFDGLPLFEGAIARSLDRREMHEDVGISFA